MLIGAARRQGKKPQLGQLAIEDAPGILPKVLRACLAMAYQTCVLLIGGGGQLGKLVMAKWFVRGGVLLRGIWCMAFVALSQ